VREGDRPYLEQALSVLYGGVVFGTENQQVRAMFELE